MLVIPARAISWEFLLCNLRLLVFSVQNGVRGALRAGGERAMSHRTSSGVILGVPIDQWFSYYGAGPKVGSREGAVGLAHR